MITLRRSSDRHRVQRAGRREWSSFHSGRSGDVFALGFGALERFDEHQFEARASLLVRPPQGLEVVSYVLSGVVACRDSEHRTAILRAGDFQRASGGEMEGLRQSNPSRSHAAHVIQVWLRHAASRSAQSTDQRHFSAAERRGALCVVAAGDAPDGVLRLQQDVRIYSAILEPGQHVVHELAARRSAWLHVVQGAVRCDDTELHAGDAATFALERAVSLTARASSEVLLIDLAHLARAAPA